MRRMILCPDFPDWVLFEAGAPVCVESLPISRDLSADLDDWYGQWSRLDEEYRANMSSDAKIDWTEFDLAGLELWKRLREELSEGFEIAFYSQRFSDSFEDPQQLRELLRSSLNA